MGIRKGQVAMEYLATYGWALFTMFAVVAVLVASGMLGSGRYQSEECTFAPNLPCASTYLVRGSSDNELIAHVNLTNAQGFPMYITDCNYSLVGGEQRALIGGDPECDLGLITRQGESVQYDIALKSTNRIQPSEIKTVYVVYTFKNCQDANGTDEADRAKNCFADDARFPRHVTSGKIVATVRN